MFKVFQSVKWPLTQSCAGRSEEKLHETLARLGWWNPFRYSGTEKHLFFMVTRWNYIILPVIGEFYHHLTHIYPKVEGCLGLRPWFPWNLPLNIPGPDVAGGALFWRTCNRSKLPGEVSHRRRPYRTPIFWMVFPWLIDVGMSENRVYPQL